jgi:hypothetical protein
MPWAEDKSKSTSGKEEKSGQGRIRYVSDGTKLTFLVIGSLVAAGLFNYPAIKPPYGNVFDMPILISHAGILWVVGLTWAVFRKILAKMTHRPVRFYASFLNSALVVTILVLILVAQTKLRGF